MTIPTPKAGGRVFVPDAIRNRGEIPPMVDWFDRQIDRQIERLERDHARHRSSIAETGERINAALVNARRGL